MSRESQNLNKFEHLDDFGEKQYHLIETKPRILVSYSLQKKAKNVFF